MLQDRLVVALMRDTYFGVNLAAFVKLFGYECRRVRTREALIETLDSTHPALVIVDLASPRGDLSDLARQAGSARLVAFAPHSDFGGRQAAVAAGFHEVVDNTLFHRECKALLDRNLPKADTESRPFNHDGGQR